MQLNFRLTPAESLTDSERATTPTVVLLHGLFGSLDNLGVLARDLRRDHPVMQLDMRNHGQSPGSDVMDYPAMAQDVLDTLESQHIRQVILLGHSMGGKVAMAFSALAAERLAALVVLDIAPVDYQVRRHDDVFAAVEAVSAARVTSRAAAAEILAGYLTDSAVVLFLLKSFYEGQWRFRVPALKAHYAQIIGWQTLPAQCCPALFIAGGDSPYLRESCQPAVFAQFPAAQLCVIPKAGHWLHAQQPQAVLAQIRPFLREHGV